MPNVKQYYQNESKYLRASDLDKGKKYKLTITGTGVVEFDNDGKKKEKILLKFSQMKKMIALKAANAMKIADVYGDEADHWIGRDIFVFNGKVPYGDNMVDSIEVEMPLKEGTIQEGVSIRENTPAEDFQAPSAREDFEASPDSFPDDIPFDIPF